MASKSDGKPEGKGLPSNALVMKELLKSMGVKEYEPRVVHQLLNFTYRYVADILQDAEAFSEHTNGAVSEVGMEDVLLAIQAREGFSFVQPPARDVLAELAARRNKQPLPELSRRPGLQVPVDALLAPNYQLDAPSDDTLPSATDDDVAEIGDGVGFVPGAVPRKAKLLPIQIKLGSGVEAAGTKDSTSEKL